MFIQKHMMRRDFVKENLSILKPDLRKKWRFEGDAKLEKVTYLNVDANVDLDADIGLGATQFSELSRLADKQKQARYVVISCNNLEQGYMAVTYLAQRFNEQAGYGSDYEENKWYANSSSSERIEIEDIANNPWYIPVIKYDELNRRFSDDDSFFSMDSGGFGIAPMRVQTDPVNEKPYWADCGQYSICIVIDDSCYFGNQTIEGLDFFDGNDRIYIIHIDNLLGIENKAFDDNSYGNIGAWHTNSLRATINIMVLNLAADEAEIRFTNAAKKKYCRLLLQGIFDKLNIGTQKSFSYNRLVNMIVSMPNTDNVCQLTEMIVNYAIKDKDERRRIELSNNDFKFMDRFNRAFADKSKSNRASKKDARKLMEEQLIGMDKVKQEVRDIIDVMKHNRMRQAAGIKGGTYHNVHMMLGAPGTAKTTMAQFMGQIMMEENLLPDNRFTKINGAELKGKYVGHSAPNTRELFEENDIIVIDEAYSIVGDNGEKDIFSSEAIAQLVIELEEHSMDKLVIFAGYGGKDVSEKDDKMSNFLNANPGIKSRITSTIYFDSYSPSEMVQIFFRIAENQKYNVDSKVQEMLLKYFKHRCAAKNFGNGREARSLLEMATTYTARRVLSDDIKKLSKEDLQTMTYEDVKNAIEKRMEEESSKASGWQGGFRG